MPISSRKAPPSQQIYPHNPTSPSVSSSTLHPVYIQSQQRTSLSTPPYHPSQIPQPSHHHFVDPFTETRTLAYGPSGPGVPAVPLHYQSRFSSPPSASADQHTITLATETHDVGNSSARLPFFEAALARSRGETPSATPLDLASPPQAPYRQPLPAYLPPPDANHPDLVVGLTQSSTVRFARNQDDPFDRGFSRSPSPGLEDSFSNGYEEEYGYDGETDVEKALLSQQEAQVLDSRPIQFSLGEKGWNDKLGSLGLIGATDEGDLSLPPFHGGGRSPIGLSSLDVRGPTNSPNESRSLSVVDRELGQSATQHFGPAPSGRVSRRTHNAAGHRRVKQTATLDDNGFFAVDMPIPTRLAQYLPVKGVEEQKSTR